MGVLLLGFLVTILVFGQETSLAQTMSVQRAPMEKKENYIESGKIVGGQYQAQLTLLNIRRSFDKSKKLERVVLDIGAADGKTPVPRAGFFHVAIQKNPARVVVDLENTTRSVATVQEISKTFANSRFYKKPILITSQAESTVTLELDLRIPAKIEVFELSGSDKSGRIVIDAVDVKSGGK